MEDTPKSQYAGSENVPNQEQMSSVPQMGKKSSSLPLVILSLVTLGSLAVATYFYMDSKATTGNCDVKCEKDDDSSEGTQNEVKGVGLPDTEDEWYFSYSSQCKAGFQVPHHYKKYIEGETVRSWRVSNRTAEREEGTVMEKLPYSYGSMLLSDDDASGYIPGVLNIDCGVNTENLTSEGLVGEYKAYAEKMNNDWKEFGSEWYYRVTDKPSTTISGMEFSVLEIDSSGPGGSLDHTIYFGTNDDMLYSLYYFTHSTDSGIKADLESIFKSIKFFD